MSRSRSGSNLLVSYLNSHTNIKCEDEIFQYINKSSFQKILNHFKCFESTQVISKGYKLFYYHPFDANNEDLWQFLKAQGKVKIIHLVRENLLEIASSQRTAEISNEYKAKGGRKSEITFELSPDLCQTIFQDTIDWREKALNFFKDWEILTVSYDSLVNDPSRIMEETQNFLEVPVENLSHRMIRQNTLALDQKISNYDELQKHFEGTEFAKFF